MVNISPAAQALFDSYQERLAAGETIVFADWLLEQGAYRDELQDLELRRESQNDLLGALFPGQLPDDEISFFQPSPYRDESVPLPHTKQLQAGETLGDFRLIRAIGAGGMGCVWEAEEHALGRRVALKVILANTQSEATAAQLSKEARAGARLSHEGIVRVYGHGETEGVHWINQELVPGGWNLRDFMDEVRSAHRLPEDYYNRATRFALQLARALASAHSAGVLHRDIKPQNILIGPDDKPKLTDFGLARILDESMSGETGRILGTILYMSPEQTDADDKSIDRRSDVFALGIVLYELLALQRPFDGDTHSQVLEKIRTFEPQRLDKLRSRLPLDLALIVGKALEKKPQDRYQTMDEFADDIQRHLDNFPVQAKAPGAMRRARKWAARNPTPTAAGAVGLIALVALSGMLSKYLDKNEALTEQTETVKLRTEDLRKRNMELEESKEVVQEERDRLEAVVFFNRSIFEGLEQESFGARLRLEIERQLTDRLAKQMASEAEISTSLEILQETLAPVNFTEIGTFAISAEVLDPAKARALNDFNNDPRIKADILSAVAFAYERLGYSENSHALRTTSLGLLRESLGDDHKLTIVALNRMFLALAYPATADLARPYAEEALERSMRVLGPNHEVTLQSVHSMGDLLRIEDRFDEAEDVLKKAAKIRSDAIGPESEAALDSSESLALVYYYQGRHVEAKEILESVLEARRRIDGSKSHAALSSMEKLAMVQVSLLEIDAALPLQEEALAGMRELLGNDHPNTRSALLVMAQIRTFTLEFDKARMLRFEALDSFRRSMGSENRVTLDLISGLAFIERSWLEFDASIKLYREAVTGFTRALGASHPRTLDERNQLGQTMLLVKRPADARHVFEEAYKLASENHGNQSEPHAKAARSLTMCYEQLLKLGPDPQISAALVKLQESK